MESIVVAAVSCVIIAGSPQANLENMARWIARAADEGAELVHFDELGVMGYQMRLAQRKLAEPLDGPSVQRLHDLARQHEIIISAGIVEKSGDKEYNTQVLVGPEGLLGYHRKSSVPGGEDQWFDVGNDYNVIDIGKCKVGVAICYESVHPETCRKLTENGAEIILAPYHNGVSAEEIHTGKRPYFTQRPKENGVWYVACEQSRIDRDNPDREINPGAVCFVNPLGEIVAVTSLEEDNEHMIVEELDLSLVRELRAERQAAGSCDAGATAEKSLTSQN